MLLGLILQTVFQYQFGDVPAPQVYLQPRVINPAEYLLQPAPQYVIPQIIAPVPVPQAQQEILPSQDIPPTYKAQSTILWEQQMKKR